MAEISPDGKDSFMSKRKIWISGIKDGIPIGLGYLAVSFAFGIQAEAIGLLPWQAALMSLTNVTSAGQFAALAQIAVGAPYWEIALTQLVLNLRYCLMSCVLSQKLERGAGIGHRFGIAFGVTDEIFALSSLRSGPLSPFYSYGLMTAAIPGWVLGTFLGVVSGDLLPADIVSALGLAIYGMFIAIIIPPARQDKVVLKVVLAAMLLATLFRYLPLLSEISSGFQIIIIAVAVAAAAAWLRPIKDGEDHAG